MTHNEQILCFLAASPTPTDPIRLMKGEFLFTMAVEEKKLPPQRALFRFRPMNYGPCAPEIYSAIEKLIAEGLIERIPVSGESWFKYAVTSRGKLRANEVANKADKRSVSFLQALRSWCDNQTFTGLLCAVYQAYPRFSTNSVLPHLRPNE